MTAVVEVTRELRLFPRQRRFVADSRRFPGYVGGIGSGKSFAGAAKAIARFEGPGLGGVFAPTYPMLRDATQRTLLGLMAELEIEFEHHKTENRITVYPHGHEVIFRSLDNPDSVRGPNLDWAWTDEASLISREASNVVKGRVRVGVNPQSWSTFTPKGRNWCWEEWERDATGNEDDPTHPLYRVKTTENPELPDDFAYSLGYTGRFAEQELGGEFVAFEGVVYPMFSRAQHVKAQNCSDWRTVLGVDIGSRNPTAILTIRKSGDRVHVEREFYRRQMDSEEITQAIIDECNRTNPEAVFVDPSANEYILAWERKGLPVRKAVNDVTYGIGLVTTALTDGMTIDPSCVNSIAEMETYHYPENRQESDKPAKESDHCMDALRYGLASESPMLEGQLVY